MSEICSAVRRVRQTRRATWQLTDSRGVVQQPGEADLGGRGAQGLGHGVYRRLVGRFGQAREGPAEREERHPGDALGRAQLQHVLVVAGDQAVGVLQADDAGGQGAAQTAEGDAAQADRADLALVAQCGHHGELVVEVDDLVPLGTQPGAGVQAAEVDDREPVDAEAAQVVLDAGAQLLGPLCQTQRQVPAGVGVSPHLRDDQDVVLGAKCLADHVVGETEAVELGGVHVVDAQLDRAAQQRDGVAAAGVQPLELQCAVADPENGPAGERSGRGDHDGVASVGVRKAVYSSSAW